MVSSSVWSRFGGGAVLAASVVLAVLVTATAPATALAGAPALGAGVAPAQAVAVTARGSGMPCARSAKACMSLSRGQAWLSDGAGHVLYGPVAAHGGSRHAATPVGTFHVLSKDAHYYSREFDAPMPYSVFFYPGDAFHADNPATASNGCIHLTAAAAQRFYHALRVGDQVQVVR